MIIENYEPSGSVIYDEKIGRLHMSTTHCHNVHELYFLKHGTINYFIDDRTYEVKTGDIFIIPAGIPHKTVTCSDTRSRALIYFEDSSVLAQELTEKLCSHPNIFRPDSELQREINGIFSKIHLESLSQKPLGDLLSKCCFNEILMLLFRENTSLKSFRIKDKLITDIEDYIKLHFADRLTLEYLAKHFHLSKSYFSRVFNQKSGMNINEYINLIRVNKAKEMLCSSRLSVTDIAMSCGFNDSNYFSTVFKRITGITPLRFRMLYHA